MKICRLGAKDFEDSKIKNGCISLCADQWLLLLKQGQKARENEIISHAEMPAAKDEYDVVCYIGDDTYGSLSAADQNKPITGSGIEMLGYFDKSIIAMLIRKDILIRTGRFHDLLDEGGNLEFLCRTADIGRACIIGAGTGKDYGENAGSGTDDATDYASDMNGEGYSESYIRALAYLGCRYNTSDPALAGFGDVLADIVRRLTGSGQIQRFMDVLSRFVSDHEMFMKWQRNTAPIYIITGDDTAYGVLNDFAMQLAKAFASQGQAVITTDGSYQPYNGVKDIEGRTLKALIGFQAPALFKEYFKGFEAPKLEFWFDDPVFFDDIFQDIEDDDNYYLLCQDGFHAEHLRRYYHIENAIHFPPGGVDAGEPDYEKKDLDAVFIGTYTDPEKIYPEDISESPGHTGLKREYIEYMLKHPDLTYEQGVDGLLIDKKQNLMQEEKKKLIWSLADAYRYVRAYFRSAVIETVLAAGLELHVYGDSWKAYEGRGKENLKIHPALKPDEASDVYRRAKISLNIMSWHKDGMTERITNSMLSSAVCVSDETKYLKKYFSNEEICLYSLKDLQGLPDMLKDLMSDENKRLGIAKKARDKACKNDTWDEKAKEILKLIC